MIKELEKIEIAACYGGAYLVTGTHNAYTALVPGVLAGLLFTWACDLAGFFCEPPKKDTQTSLVGYIIGYYPLVLGFSVVAYCNSIGKKYTLDLDL